MSDTVPKRSTSFAKTVDGLAHQESALDRALSLKQEFNRAQTDHERSRLRETESLQKTDGSAHAPLPEPHLRPQGEIRRAVDRQIDNAKRAQDRQRAMGLKEAYKKRAEQQETLDLSEVHGKTMRHGR